MTTTNRQVWILMNEISKHGKQTVAAAKAGLCRQTAAKYRKLGKLPSELKRPRDWRTRADPFAEVWAEIEAQLQQTPGLWIPTLFEALQARHPGQFPPGQIRTLYRQVRRWRALHDDDTRYAVYFPQHHRPGEALQTDFTHLKTLAITIAGEPLRALLCHVVLPYSNWGWATRCYSESFLALKTGLQEAVFRLGRVPIWHQTDNSTGATHRIRSSGRAFNADYRELMQHLGMKPRTTAVGCKEQNGTVEALNGAFKRFLDQQLRLRGQREFDSEADFDQWLQSCLQKANSRREAKLSQELAVMSVLSAPRLPDYQALTRRVSRNATLNVHGNLYSVPARLIHHQVTVRRFETQLQVYDGEQLIQTMPRLSGRGHHGVDYRHVIHALVQKPQAFARYRYQSALLPTPAFHRAYQTLQAAQPGLAGDKAYLRVLQLAALHGQAEVESAVQLLLEEGQVPSAEPIKALLGVAPPPPVPALAAPTINLHAYDRLLAGVCA